MFLKDFLKKKDLKKSADNNKNMKNYPACKDFMILIIRLVICVQQVLIF